MATVQFDRTIEAATGQTAEHARQTPLDELRRAAESRLGKPIKFCTSYPWAGRGNVMRDRLVSHEEVEADYDDAIRQL